jgi:hypothetical protein
MPGRLLTGEGPPDVRYHTRKEPSPNLAAVPLGGPGTGSLELHSDGSFREWQMFNNRGNSERIGIWEHWPSRDLPGSFLAVRVAADGIQPVAGSWSGPRNSDFPASAGSPCAAGSPSPNPAIPILRRPGPEPAGIRPVHPPRSRRFGHAGRVLPVPDCERSRSRRVAGDDRFAESVWPPTTWLPASLAVMEDSVEEGLGLAGCVSGGCGISPTSSTPTPACRTAPFWCTTCAAGASGRCCMCRTVSGTTRGSWRCS